MSNMRVTMYLKPELHKALKYKSAETAQSLSNLVNEALMVYLAEDAADLAAIEERQNEKGTSFASVLKELKNDGLI